MKCFGFIWNAIYNNPTFTAQLTPVMGEQCTDSEKNELQLLWTVKITSHNKVKHSKCIAISFLIWLQYLKRSCSPSSIQNVVNRFGVQLYIFFFCSIKTGNPFSGEKFSFNFSHFHTLYTYDLLSVTERTQKNVDTFFSSVFLIKFFNF